jgi:hypothetical protein
LILAGTLTVAATARAQGGAGLLATTNAPSLTPTNAPIPAAPTNEATETLSSEPLGRLLGRRFRDYTIILFAPTNEVWETFWNDPQQMARFENPTNGVMITSQFMQFPTDPALQQAVGDRDRYLDLALRKYCAALFSLTRDPEIAAQPVATQGRRLGDHYFRFCPMWARDRTGAKRLGYVYLMLRGRQEKPKFTGEMLLLTIGYPELLAPSDEKRARDLFDVLLQNLSFL